MTNSAKSSTHQSRRGTFRSALFAMTALLSFVLLMRAYAASAQDVTVALPDEYGAPISAAAREQLPDPAAILEDDGSTFSIPIPGGGSIEVQGPVSEPAVPRSPIENWAVQRNNPFSVGGGPIGPNASQ